jgi:probable F420-dependent oxidoreductase
MEFGIQLPVAGYDASPEVIGRFAADAERIGLASVWTSDCLLRPVEQPIEFGNGMSIEMPELVASQYEPLETLSYVAAKTSTIKLGTSVIVAILQNPAALARRFATLDQLSAGRVIAGLGQGWVPQSFTAANVSPKHKGARFEEHIQALRAAWGPDPVRFEGRYYTIAESQIGPKPVRPDGPTVLAGAATPAGVERAGRLGVGINPVFFNWDALTGQVTTFRAAAAAAGHDPDSLPIVLRVNGDISDNSAEQQQPLTGPIDRVAADIERVRSLGINHIAWAMFVTKPDEQLRLMERLTRVV